MTAPARQPKRVLLAGTFLSGTAGTRAPIEDLAERLTEAGYSCICVSSIRSGLLRSAHLLLTALVARSRYDVAVVDLYSGNAFLWGEAMGILLRALRVPFICSMHGGALPDFAATRERRVRACLQRASAVTAPSPWLLDAMQQYYPGAVLLPNPLDLPRYPFRLRSSAKPKLVWVRRFHRMYNPMLAPQVLAILASRYPEISLTMVGRDDLDGSFDETRSIAKKLGVLDRISFTGAIANPGVPKYLDTSDIFLNTTDVDNTPVSVMEAMACGLCVVSTSAGGVPILIENETDGLLAPCGDAGGLAGAVERILSNHAFARKLSHNARRKAERFDWSRVLPMWESLLARIDRQDAPAPELREESRI